MRVRISDSSSCTAWYADKIGEEFEVTARDDKFLRVTDQPKYFILKDDCVAVETTKTVKKNTAIDYIEARIQDIAVTTAYIYNELKNPKFDHLDVCYRIAKEFCAAYPPDYSWELSANMDWETEVCIFAENDSEYREIDHK